MSDAKKVLLVGGGVRSGKSAFAISLARRLGKRRVFLATAEPLDPEMRRRITDHVQERGDDFVTVEEPLMLPERLTEIRDVDVVVVDCLTLWLSNLLLRNESESRILQRVEKLAIALERRRFHAILVTNEVGLGIIPENSLGRVFRDLAGRAHQRLAKLADEVYFFVLGSMLQLKPSSVSQQTMGGDL